MALEKITLRFNISKMSAKCFILLLISDFINCYTNPYYTGKRYLRTVPLERAGFLPIPLVYHHNEHQVPDYDDGYLPGNPDEYEYTPYEKYPFVQYFGYYPNRDYYRDKATRRSVNNFGYFDDTNQQDSIEDISDDILRNEKDEIYPFGQETWYDEELPRYDVNAEANAAFLQNLIMAQMYQDGRNKYPYAYESSIDDYDDQNWFYGVPTTEVEEKEKVKQYFKNKEDEEVKELESLARKKEHNKKIKEKDNYKKQKNVEIIEKPTKPKSKMTDEEYFDLQKQLIINSRKDGYTPMGKGLKINKKQFYSPADVKNSEFYSYRSNNFPETATNSIKKLNSIKDGNKPKGVALSAGRSTVESSTVTVSTTVSPKRPEVLGQKEVVLPRPSTPGRRPLVDISTRSSRQPSVYDTIKKLLNMEKDLQKSDISQPQKRFVLNEDQLTKELSGLKKLAA